MKLKTLEIFILKMFCPKLSANKFIQYNHVCQKYLKLFKDLLFTKLSDYEMLKLLSLMKFVNSLYHLFHDYEK
jgi:hypothetical protein